MLHKIKDTPTQKQQPVTWLDFKFETSGSFLFLSI